jgi:superfamily II DNA/RNA helicase
MPEIHPQEFLSQISSTFRRYLFTQNFVADSDADLRNAFWDALQEPGLFYGPPLVSALPAYETAASARSLLGRSGAPFLHPSLGRLPPNRFDLDRPLYSHQIASLRLIQEEENVVVASGTGSGKTECFLLPILDDCARNPGSGVRAILVYPLNALANDQLSRLRELLAGLPEITFGRYTGDTPETKEDARPEALAQVLRPNERFTRAEIRDSPPHILLTNFAMLEYLLLRPKDDALFRNQRLRFVVLDEAHTYTGAQGIDVALLMRRLKYAFVRNRQQFVLTSATIGGDREKIREFAERLTGADFKEDSVLAGTVVSQFDLTTHQHSLKDYTAFLKSEAVLAEWLTALDAPTGLLHLIRKSGLEPTPRESSTGSSTILWEWFARNRELAEMHRLLQLGPSTVDSLSEQIWGVSTAEARRVTLWLLTLGARAKKESTSAPLLPARFHFFFRGLRGASVCLSPGCEASPERSKRVWSKLIVEDRATCPSCEAHMLPLLTCVHCGTPYVRVYVDGTGGWQAQQAMGTKGQNAHLLIWNGDRKAESDAEDELAAGSENVSKVTLCLSCRSITQVARLLPCCQSPRLVELEVALGSDGEGNLPKCVACGGRSGGFESVLRDFRTGEDAASAVIAEAIIRAMPEEDISLPAFGRRLLAFSDSRQRAAHFAPYLSRTTAETQYMKPVVDAIRSLSGDRLDDIPLTAVADRFLADITKQPFVVLRQTLEGEGEITAQIKSPKQLYRQDKDALRRECLISLLQSFTAPIRAKNTLTAFAIAAIVIELNEEQVEQFLKRVPELFMRSEAQGLAAIQHLLRLVFRKRAISFPNGINLGHIQTSGGPQQYVMHYSLADRFEGRQRIRWNPYEAKLKQVTVPRSLQAHVVAQVLGINVVQDAERISDVLRRIWDTMRDFGVLEQWEANEYVLPHQQVMIRTRGPWFVCDDCGVVTTDQVSDACLVPGCSGRTVELNRAHLDERYGFHHAFIRTTRMEPLPLAVREHTAQLTTEFGQKYQQDFVNGSVNVLSSSTTFEMGVDVGQLKTVFLRNVPPTAANYIQRAGRAGRRKEGSAYALTYARAFPHDQIHYHEPIAIVAGTVPVPQINLANRRLAQRHANSFLLGRFFLSSASDISTAEGLFEGNPSVASIFRDWLQAESGSLGTALSQILPRECEIDGAEALTSAGILIREVEEKYRTKLAGFEQQSAELRTRLQEELASSGNIDRRSAALQDHLSKLIAQLRKSRIIDYLASEHWLPGYAFPQDVVRLLVRESKLVDRLRLERDAEYGIAEYAPGSEVIADGYLIRSRGIDKQGQELNVEGYRACSVCNNVEFSQDVKALSGACHICGAPPRNAASRARQYVIPPGFTTDINERAEEVRFGRLRSATPSKIFLIAGATEESFVAHLDLPGVTTGYREDGELFRACSARKGAPFRICIVCGKAMEAGGKTKHQKPWGIDCPSEKFSHVDLAYRFKTDTLQVRFDSAEPHPPGVKDTAFWLSFQTAFVGAAAEVLSIPPRDLDGTYRTQASPDSKVELVVFDRIPGGAGYVHRVRQDLRLILSETLSRVQTCRNPRCDRKGSCYCCLRTYYNQFQWEDLRREDVVNWLGQYLSGSPKAS